MKTNPKLNTNRLIGFALGCAAILLIAAYQPALTSNGTDVTLSPAASGGKVNIANSGSVSQCNIGQSGTATTITWSDGTTMSSNTSGSQWVTNGSNIYYNVGAVGMFSSGQTTFTVYGGTRLDAYDANTVGGPRVATFRRGDNSGSESGVTTFGLPYVWVGGAEYKANIKQMIGFGYHLVDVDVPPAEIGFDMVSTTGNTKGDIVVATRNVTTNTTATERLRVAADGTVSTPGGKLPAGFASVEAVGALAADANFTGGWRTTNNVLTVGTITCSWTTQGTNGAGAGNVDVKVRNTTDGTDLCSCSLGLCNATANVPLSCACATASLAAKSYTLRFATTSDCTVFPANTICDLELTR